MIKTALNRSNIIGIVMLAASIMPYITKLNIKAKEIKHNVDLETIVPTKFYEWIIDDTAIPMLINPDIQVRLEKIYSQVLTRTYKNKDNKKVMLSIVYGANQSDELRAHKPEVCYSAQGFSVSKVRNDNIVIDEKDNLPVKRLNAISGFRREPITYWIVVGNKVVNNNLQRKIEQIKYRINGTFPHGLVIRVSTFGEDLKLEYSVHDAFVKALVKNLSISSSYVLTGL